jgi:hypothetical protein
VQIFNNNLAKPLSLVTKQQTVILHALTCPVSLSSEIIEKHCRRTRTITSKPASKPVRQPARVIIFVAKE